VYYSPIPEIDVNQLTTLLTSNASIQFIDVREQSEADLAQIPGFTLYPLSEFEQWSGQILRDLKPEVETIVICHHGMRSAQLCQWLTTRGFSQVKNVMGGIDAYSRLVDSSIRRY
jgi:rhodanese-related sulfurtransferase